MFSNETPCTKVSALIHTLQYSNISLRLQNLWVIRYMLPALTRLPWKPVWLDQADKPCEQRVGHVRSPKWHLWKKNCENKSGKKFALCFATVHYRQRGGPKKGHQGACYSLWNIRVKLLASLKKDPSCFRKCPEQCFLRPDLNFFWISKKNFILHKRYLQDDH